MNWKLEDGQITDKGFRGEFNFLSNFYPADKIITMIHPFCKDKEISSRYVEVLYQACKTKNEDEVDMILKKQDPRIAKSLSHKIEVNPNFFSIDEHIMEYLVSEKFSKSPRLRDRLKNIEGRIIEWNYWHDQKWGVDVRTGVGENKLGLILEAVRDMTKGVTL